MSNNAKCNIFAHKNAIILYSNERELRYIDLHNPIIPLFNLIHNNIFVTPYDYFLHLDIKLVNKYTFYDKMYNKIYIFGKIRAGRI